MGISSTRLFTTALCALGLGFATACAGLQPHRSPADLLYPPLPQAPRIRYLESFYGSDYFLPKTSRRFLDWLVGGEPSLNFVRPVDVVVDAKGSIYVTDSPGYILVLDREKQLVRPLGDQGQARVVGAGGLAIDRQRNELYAVDTEQRVVLVIDPVTNNLVRQLKVPQFNRPVAAALDENRLRLAVMDRGAHDIKILDALTGDLLHTLGSVGSEDGQFYFPLRATFDREGNLYVVDAFNFRIQVFDTNYQFVRTFGEMGQSPSTFSRPKGIAVDSEGNIYVVDAAFATVQIFGPEGDFHMSFGLGGVNPGEFQLPNGIFIDAQDRIYVVDSLNNRVQVFQYIPKSEAKELAKEYRIKIKSDPESSREPVLTPDADAPAADDPESP